MSRLLGILLASSTVFAMAGTPAGDTANGIHLNGFNVNGLDQNGFRKNGVAMNRLALNGAQGDMPGQLNGIPLGRVGIR